MAAVRDCFTSFAAQESVMLTRETKKGPRTSDIRRHLLRWKELEDGSLEDLLLVLRRIAKPSA